ncbi:hypothetical protein EB118_11410 [bacterium]|nr:hypothetical protein [bacterium]NDD83462.1 hypothetical protein [bacterium]NDG30665.1 hypothetical protein [bacterium]
MYLGVILNAITSFVVGYVFYSHQNKKIAQLEVKVKYLENELRSNKRDSLIELAKTLDNYVVDF